MLFEISLVEQLNILLPLSWLAALLTVPSVLTQRAGQPAAALSWLLALFECHSMLHTKALLLDHESVLIGSANLDVRSFKLNFEISTFVNQPDVNDALAFMLADVQRESSEITLENIKNTSTLTLLKNALAHRLSPLL